MQAVRFESTAWVMVREIISCVVCTVSDQACTQCFSTPCPQDTHLRKLLKKCSLQSILEVQNTYLIPSHGKYLWSEVFAWCASHLLQQTKELIIHHRSVEKPCRKASHQYCCQFMLFPSRQPKSIS